MDVGYCPLFFFASVLICLINALLFTVCESFTYLVHLTPKYIIGSLCCSSFNSYLLNAVPDTGVGNTTHSSVLAWKIPWTEKPCGLWSMGSQRVGHD